MRSILRYCNPLLIVLAVLLVLSAPSLDSEVSNQYGASEDKIQEAIDQCPVQCIHW